MTQDRVRAGVPAGGQFATSTRTEAMLTLTSTAECPTVAPLKDMGPRELGEAIRAGMAAAHPGRPDIAHRVDQAIRFAETLHRDQRRANPTMTTAGAPHPGEQPYVVHPLRNALCITRWGETDPDVIIGAVLHDVVEDQSARLAEQIHPDAELSPQQQRTAALQVISANFGEGIGTIVASVSNPLPKQGLSKTKKRDRYVRHVEQAVDDYQVFLVKASDFVDNALGLHHQQGRSKSTKYLAWKYLPLCRVFTAAVAKHQVSGHQVHPDLADKLAGAEMFLSALASPA